MARPLTPDELTRYPWASQISDYVPVGTLRASGLLIGIAGFCVLLCGTIVSLAQAENIHHAVTMQHLPTVLGVYVGMALTIAAAVIGVVTGVQGIVKRGCVVAALVVSRGDRAGARGHLRGPAAHPLADRACRRGSRRSTATAAPGHGPPGARVRRSVPVAC